MLRLVCCRRQSGSIPGNLTSLLNRKNKTDNYEKFGKNSVPVGVPRLSRSETRPISILHETKHITVAGRNFCNNFSNNQFLVINKLNKEAIFVDACDDWPDDWAAFVSASRVTPTHVFLTHCHVDNVINLNALLVIIEKHLGKRLGIMWSPAELPWVREFPRACQRYGRVLEMRESLPMLHNSTYAYYTYKNELKRKQEVLNQQFRDAYGGELEGIGPDGERIIPPQVVRTDDVLLSSATNRSTSFHELGPHCTLHYVSTPGHSPGHTMLSLPRERLLFTGDLLFYNKVGRVDLPFASGELLAESLMALEGFPDNTVVLPGHGRLTTLGRERRENTALRTLYERRASGMQEVSVGFNEGYL